ncbi:MAG: phosphoribosylamine--glycine ligase, partial [Muribaculaceae bacterium]|nr:phosphoribosylamine--glycine ligase [Muribaculaceae bacterium]
RVLAVTSLAETVAAAREKSYKALENICFEGLYRRGDIGCDILEMMK